MGAATVTISSPEDLLRVLAEIVPGAPARYEVRPPGDLDDESRAGWEVGVATALIDAGVAPEAIGGVAPKRVHRVAQVARSLAAGASTSPAPEVLAP